MQKILRETGFTGFLIGKYFLNILFISHSSTRMLLSVLYFINPLKELKLKKQEKTEISLKEEKS